MVRTCSNCSHNDVCSITAKIYDLIMGAGDRLAYHADQEDERPTTTGKHDLYQTLAGCCLSFEASERAKIAARPRNADDDLPF